MGLERFFIQMGLSAKFAGDASLVLVLAAVSAAFGIFMGRSRLSNFLINAYIAAAIALAFPLKVIGGVPYAQTYIFLGLVVVFNLLATHLFDIHIPGSAPSILGRMLVLSFLEVGMTLSFLLMFLPERQVLKFISSNAYFYFASPYAQIFWLLTPLVFLLFINRRYS